MNALLVGADRLGNIPDLLTEFGIRICAHVSGRQPGHQKRAAVPVGIEIVILFTDFLSHNVMRSFRDAARQRGLPLLCCRRSASSLRKALLGLAGTGRPVGMPAAPDQNAIRLAPSNRRVQ